MAFPTIETSLAKDLPLNKQIKNTAPVDIKVSGKPSRGMSTRTVEKQFGHPKNIIKAIGKPPISRWVYKNFTVYFESSYVIHTVDNDTKNSKAK